jgi:hypothetical protein
MKGSANFNPKAWERVRTRVVRDIPALSLSDADRLLTAAGADRPKALNRVDNYLAATADAVLAPDASCPLPIARLTHLLLAEGHTSVTPPSCTGASAVCLWRRLGRPAVSVFVAAARSGRSRVRDAESSQ